MKRIITYIGIGAITLIAVLLLAGCFWTPGEGTGSITMDLGSLRDAKAISDNADTVRIYLQQESSGSYFAFEGTSLYIQENIPAEENDTRTLTIDGIPAGNWLLVVAAGKVVDNGGFFPTNYGISETNIAAGTENPVTMELGDQPPFEIAENLVGKEITGAVEYGGNVYTLDAESQAIYFGDVGSLTAIELSTVPEFSGYTVYSINKGFINSPPPANDAIWFNTDKGIISYTVGGYDDTFQTTEFPVKESGGFYDTDVSELYVYYRLPNGFGGTEYGETWYKYDQFDEYFTGNFIRQFFVHELAADSDTYAYFASSLGAFRVNSANIDTQIDNFIVEADFFEVSADGESVPIRGLAYRDADQMVLATDSGVFIGSLAVSDSVLTGVQRIANTEGIKFTRVAVSGDGTYIAALTADASMYIFKDLGSSFEMKEFPFYTGFPGGVSQMAFVPGSSVLYISGEGQDFASGGFAKVDVAAQF